MSLSWRESKLKTFTIEAVIARVKHVSLKSNYCLHPRIVLQKVVPLLLEYGQNL